MKISLLAGALLLVTGVATFAEAQDGGLGRGRGRGGGGGGGQPSQPAPPPPRNDPPRNDPPRRSDPTRGEPTREPRRDDPGPSSPPASPSQRDPLRRGDPVRNDPPRSDPNRGPIGGPSRGGLGRGPIGIPSGRDRQGPYGTVNNGPAGRSPVIVQSAPGRGDFSRMPNRVSRTDRIGIVSGYRVGYVHYNRSWRDDFFNYGFYGFSPFGGFQYVSSPFYGYAFLPPYISYNRIVISSGYTPGWAFSSGYPVVWGSNGWSYNGYNGNYDNGYDNGYGDGYRAGQREFRSARDAVDDLRYAFLDNDPRSYERLLPRNGTIAILRDGEYDYSLSPQDFEGTLRDLVENSRTEGYRIEDSRVQRNQVRVVARHDYTDPWNQRRTMYHHILLVPESGRYVIREFGTSSRRYW